MYRPGCSVQEELFMSFEQVLAVSDRNRTPFDRIVLENSGVAEPQNIRDAFAEAVDMGHPVVNRVHLSTMVRPLELFMVLLGLSTVLGLVFSVSYKADNTTQRRTSNAPVCNQRKYLPCCLYRLTCYHSMPV